MGYTGKGDCVKTENPTHRSGLYKKESDSGDWIIQAA